MKHLRKKKLIEPRLQLRFAALFFSIAALSALLQMIVMGFMLQRIATSVPEAGEAILRESAGILLTGLALTLGILGPITLAIGIRATFPIVGPLYRFRVHLGQLARGEDVPPCRIRKTDELQDLCGLINEATDSLKKRGTAEEKPSEAA